MAALAAKHGDVERARAERGVAQAAAFWRPGDGDAKAFEAFCGGQFLPRGEALDATFARLEASFEALDGHALEIYRELSRYAQLDEGPMRPVDALLAAHDASAHTIDNLFAEKIAFVALLNFPLTTLDERLAQGERWSPARVGGGAPREPVRAARARGGEPGHRPGRRGRRPLHRRLQPLHAPRPRGGRRRLFPRGSGSSRHWNLRDEIKAQYAQPDGLARQRLIAKSMERIVSQTIPAAVVNDPRVDWNPVTNEVGPRPRRR